MNFVAIDFETATAYRHSACAVGIVVVENGKIVEEFHTLIQPPHNEYLWRNIDVHGIKPEDTINAPDFQKVFPEIQRRIAGKTIVAHNESFDRSVLKRTMEHYGLDYGGLQLSDRWECTYRIFKARGVYPTKLNCCCEKYGIELNHHEALSDARACAKLYLIAGENE